MKNINTIDIAARIRQIRSDFNMSQKKFSESLCIPENTYCELENGSIEFPGFICAVIAIKFKASMKWIMTGEGERYIELPKREYHTQYRDSDVSILHENHDNFRKIYKFLLDLEKDFLSTKNHTFYEYAMYIDLKDSIEKLCYYFLTEENNCNAYSMINAFKLPLLSPEEMAELEAILEKQDGSRRLFDKIHNNSFLLLTREREK